MNHTDDTYDIIKALASAVRTLEEENNRLINWKNNFRERIEKIEQELWKKNVERDHVEYDFIGQMDKTAREIGEYLEGEKDESDR